MKNEMSLKMCTEGKNTMGRLEEKQEKKIKLKNIKRKIEGNTIKRDDKWE